MDVRVVLEQFGVPLKCRDHNVRVGPVGRERFESGGGQDDVADGTEPQHQ
jgi:hypothetical protein